MVGVGVHGAECGVATKREIQQDTPTHGAEADAAEGRAEGREVDLVHAVKHDGSVEPPRPQLELSRAAGVSRGVVVRD